MRTDHLLNENYCRPEPQEITLDTIANTLARLIRFGGRWIKPLSVARHSIWVSRSLEDQGEPASTQLCGLMHDAAEAYTCDIPQPLKRSLLVRKPDGDIVPYSEFEDTLTQRIFEQLGLPWPIPPVVHEVDHQIVQKEIPLVSGLERGPAHNPELEVILFQSLFMRLRNKTATEKRPERPVSAQ